MRRRRVRSLFFEPLEARVVLDGHLGSAVGEQALEDAPAMIEQFESAEALQQFLIDTAVDRLQAQFGQKTYHHGYYPPVFALDGQLGIEDAMPRTTEIAAAGFDGTNVQVAGVDEGDVVKTDGDFIYVSANGELSIIDATNPEELVLTSQIELDSNIRELYVTENHLTLISTHFDFIALDFSRASDAILPYDAGGPETTVTVYDISDRSAPVWVSDTTIDGSLASSRRLDDLVYVVTNQHLASPHLEAICEDEGSDGAETGGIAVGEDQAEGAFLPYPWPQSNCVYETEVAYVARVSDSIVETVLPQYSVAQEAEIAIGGLLTAPEEVYKPILEDARNLSSITVIDVTASTDGIVSSATLPTNYSTTVYASHNNLYLATNLWSEDGGETQLQQFTIGDEGGVVLSAVGEVGGTLLNQFSLDEHNGNLRVVTTSGWGDNQVNSLFVLSANEQGLEVVGEIESIAPGERVFAARFLGDKAFVVTFRQIDPLFTIDLSDPATPTIEGELEIPGFSNYLHPISDDLIVGLGQDGASWRSPTQLSLFDVSDFANPERIDQQVFESYRWSEARYNHHAFSYFADSQTIVIPFAEQRGWCIDGSTSGQCVEDRPASFWVFQVDADSEDPLHLLGTVEHESHPLRSVRIGENLFTVSTDTIKGNELLNPEVQVDSLYFGKLAFNDHFTIDISSEPKPLDVLANDRDADNGEIVSVEAPPGGGSVQVSRDGKSVIYSPPTDGLLRFDSFTYTVGNGDRTDTASVHITLTVEAARERMIRLSKEEFAERAEISVEEIKLESITRQTWPDSCLGVDPGEGGCADVVTPGFHIRVSAAGGLIGYHTDLVDQVVVAHSALRLSSDNFDVEGQSGPVTLDVLKDDGAFAHLLQIIEVSDSEGTVTIAEDGKSLLYEVTSDTPSDRESFRYTVQLGEGVTNSANVNVVVKKETFDDLIDASVNSLAAHLEVPADSIRFVATQRMPSFFWCPDEITHACHFRIKIGLQHEDRFYVYFAREHRVLLDHVFEPQLRDDRAEIRDGSEVIEIDVLRNDALVDGSFTALHADPRVITAVGESQNGATITFGEEAIQYTPSADFDGDDTFTYSVGDLTAEVHVRVMGASFPGDDPVVSIRPQVVDANGDVVETLHSGDSAVLQVFVEDLRVDAKEVFAAFTDVEFAAAQVAEIGEIDHSGRFGSLPSGVVDAPGLIDELGGVQFDHEAIQSGEQLLASISFIAGEPGTLTFFTSPPDSLPNHQILVLGSDAEVPAGRVDFGSASVEIIDNWHNAAMPMDTNGDGEGTPVDALLVINFLNDEGSQSVDSASALRAGSFGQRERHDYLDVNRDRHITPIDALIVINRIAEHLAANAEGEAVESDIAFEPAGVDGVFEILPAVSTRRHADFSAERHSAEIGAARRETPAEDSAWRSRPLGKQAATSRQARMVADEAFAELSVDEQKSAEWWLS